MLETKRHTEVFTPPEIKIPQEKRGVISFFQTPQTTKTTKSLLTKCRVLLFRPWPRVRDGDASGRCLLKSLHGNSVDPPMFGYDVPERVTEVRLDDMGKRTGDAFMLKEEVGVGSRWVKSFVQGGHRRCFIEFL